ncbi:MAG: DUF5806 family protein [Methanoregula sp.]|uniref:DUF5806 family protein n=1 Tax=Methanoregula sp. TaxID=2052170 RepID=UPI003C209D9A
MDDAGIQQEINKYKKFKKVDGATYRKVNQFLRKRTYITAREWALARLCTDFRTSGGAEMTFIGKHLPELVPFMEDTYTPQAVNQARHSFKKKVRKASATFFYGAMCGFFTTDELDDLLFEASEVSRFLLEVEGTTLDIDEEIDIEDRITRVMRSVGETAKTIFKTRVDDETVLKADAQTTPIRDKPSSGSDHLLNKNSIVPSANNPDYQQKTGSKETLPTHKITQKNTPAVEITKDLTPIAMNAPSTDISGSSENNVPLDKTLRHNPDDGE